MTRAFDYYALSLVPATIATAGTYRDHGDTPPGSATKRRYAVRRSTGCASSSISHIRSWIRR
jgi:hypothetical protein